MGAKNKKSVSRQGNSPAIAVKTKQALPMPECFSTMTVEELQALTGECYTNHLDMVNIARGQYFAGLLKN